MNITISDAKIGENTTVIVEVLDGAKGNITVDYSGDDTYAPKSNNTIIDSKGDYDWEVIIPEITDDKNTTISVIVPKDATGNVTVTVGDNEHNGTVNNVLQKLLFLFYLLVNTTSLLITLVTILMPKIQHY